MELSKRTQTIIALVSGALLGAVLVAIAMQSYYKSQIDHIMSERTSQTSQASSAEASPATTKTEDQQKIAATTTTPSNQTTPAEQPAQPTETPAAAPESATAPKQEAIQETTAPQTTEPQEKQSEAAATQAATTASTYAYTAKLGDSYSVLARKAIQTYGLKNKITLSPAQIIAAEAFLTAQAGSPELNEGQQVVITIDSVKSSVDSAQKLSTGDLALWDSYAQNVDFDTSHNG